MKNPLSLFSRNRSDLPMSGPWRAMAELENEMERWFGTRLPSSFTGVPEGFDFSPSCDLRENSKEYVLKFDIPGIKKEDVKVEVDGNRITISGERKQEREDQDARQHFTETYYGSFMRSFTLPQKVDETKVKANYEDGVLKVTIPKTEPSSGKTVEIQ